MPTNCQCSSHGQGHKKIRPLDALRPRPGLEGYITGNRNKMNGGGEFERNRNRFTRKKQAAVVSALCDYALRLSYIN